MSEQPELGNLKPGYLWGMVSKELPETSFEKDMLCSLAEN